MVNRNGKKLTVSRKKPKFKPLTAKAIITLLADSTFPFPSNNLVVLN